MVADISERPRWFGERLPVGGPPATFRASAVLVLVVAHRAAPGYLLNAAAAVRRQNAALVMWRALNRLPFGPGHWHIDVPMPKPITIEPTISRARKTKNATAALAFGNVTAVRFKNDGRFSMLEPPPILRPRERIGLGSAEATGDGMDDAPAREETDDQRPAHRVGKGKAGQPQENGVPIHLPLPAPQRPDAEIDRQSGHAEERAYEGDEDGHQDACRS